MIGRHPALAGNAMRVIGGRLQDAHRRLREISTEDVERRVAHAVLKLADEAGKASSAGTGNRFSAEPPGYCGNDSHHFAHC